MEAYRVHAELIFWISGIALVAASWALWRWVAARRQGHRQSNRLVPSALVLLILASAYNNPFVCIPVAEAYMGAIKSKALEHVGAATGDLIEACGPPSAVSDSWLVYKPPRFLLWPVDLRVLVSKDRVLAAYLDD